MRAGLRASHARKAGGGSFTPLPPRWLGSRCSRRFASGGAGAAGKKRRKNKTEVARLRARKGEGEVWTEVVSSPPRVERLQGSAFHRAENVGKCGGKRPTRDGSLRRQRSRAKRSEDGHNRAPEALLERGRRENGEGSGGARPQRRCALWPASVAFWHGPSCVGLVIMFRRRCYDSSVHTHKGRHHASSSSCMRALMCMFVGWRD